MTKRFSDISLEIPTVLTRLTLLKRRLAGKNSLVTFASSDLGTSFSPQSAASNLPWHADENDHSSTLLLLKAHLIREICASSLALELSRCDQLGADFPVLAPQGWSSARWRGFSSAAEIRRTLLLGKWSSLLSAFESRRFAEFPPRFRDIVDNLRCHWPNLFSRSSFSASSSAERRSLGISSLAVLHTENFVGLAE